MDNTVAAARVGITRAHGLLRGVVDDLTEAHVGGRSQLPGWSRGHVLAHITGLAQAVVGQIEAAVAGEVREVYAGGRPARDAAIEARAGVSAVEHPADVLEWLERVEAASTRLDGEVLDRPTAYRDGPASGVLLMWWREALIHVTDLGLGVGPLGAWDAPFRDHLAEFLADRVPDDVGLDLEPWDVDEPRTIGTGAPVVVQGAANDLFAWLAGRDPGGTVVAERDGVLVPLPELLPWPSAPSPTPA